ncbi:hypothetical protein C8F01DRAFT_1321581 [Mycena amicta]|nr:hypothetical protein C8F01DRAFT_1321581 [Mycena amicta]
MSDLTNHRRGTSSLIPLRSDAVSIPAELDKFLATQAPGPSKQYRQDAFDNLADIFGGFNKAVDYFEDARTQRVADRPPKNIPLKSANVGPWKIFYHPVFPPTLQRSAPWMWTFYIGERDQDSDSIMTDWQKRGIRVQIKGFTDAWQDCSLFVVAASTRVRVSTSTVSQELVFPPDPRDAAVPAVYLT